MLYCKNCGASFAEEELKWRCPCGSYLDLDTDSLRYAPRENMPGLWRYAAALPVQNPSDAVSLGEGATPLVPALWKIGSQETELHLKYEALNPTGSYKDRGISVAVSRFRELGVSRLVEDSSGNAGAAMAGYCARAGIACEIYVPAHASEGKCVQIEAYGAKLIRVPGTREDTTAAALRAAESIYYGSHNWSPYFVHGIKTYAYEIYEQLGKAPDVLLAPAGQGSLIMGACLAFKDLLAAGLIKRMPRLLGVQSELCNPLYQGWKAGKDDALPIQKGQSMAEGIASATPLRGREVLAAVRETDGAFASVSERAIWSAFEELALKGLYVEPTSAAVIAGLKSFVQVGIVDLKNESCAVLLSGSGLKATDKILELRNNPPK